MTSEQLTHLLTDTFHSVGVNVKSCESFGDDNTSYVVANAKLWGTLCDKGREHFVDKFTEKVRNSGRDIKFITFNDNHNHVYRNEMGDVLLSKNFRTHEFSVCIQ